MSNPDEAKPRPAKFLIIFGDDFWASDEEEDAGTGRGDELFERLQPPVGDVLLTALRRIFTLTYSRETLLPELEKTVADIRHAAIEALRDFGPMLQSLRLKPFGPGSLPRSDEAQVFKFLIVPAKELRIPVKVEETGETRPLCEVARTAPADPLLIAMRAILSLTFTELITRKAYARAIWQIRDIAAKAVVPLSEWLECIDIEPVAMPVREYSDDDWEDDPEHPFTAKDEEERPKARQLTRPEDVLVRSPDGLDIMVSEKMLKRAASVFDRLRRKAIKKGLDIVVLDEAPWHGTYAIRGEERVPIRLREATRRIPPSKRVERGGAVYSYEPSGVLVLTLGDGGLKGTWRATKHRPLEDCLGDVVSTLLPSART